MPSPVILWFRRDLRLADNPALAAALKAEAPVIPVYVLDEAPEVRPMGAASLWWLDKSLTALAADLEARGSRLTLRRGDAERLIPELAAETGASAVLWNGLFDPGLAPRDTRLAEVLTARGVEPRRFNGAHLIQPEAVRTKTGGAFSVFTPFWRTARQLVTLGAAQPAPDILTAP
ncbi:deoxyribodipyrimidine photo-lyase, partial [Phenylobacterium aquaticum]